MSSLNISIPILNDTLQESSETVILTLSSPTNATLGAPNPATLTIIDDESPPPAPEELDTYDVLGNITFKTGVGTYNLWPAECAVSDGRADQAARGREHRGEQLLL